MQESEEWRNAPNDFQWTLFLTNNLLTSELYRDIFLKKMIDNCLRRQTKNSTRNCIFQEMAIKEFLSK